MNVELRALLDAFGVMWDPAIIWNAIPFSFVLDWIWDVSEWLGKWARPNLPVQLRIMDFYILWKYSGHARVETDHIQGVWTGSSTDTTTQTVRNDFPTERFVRVRFTPDNEHLVLAKWDRNVVDKTLLGGALVTTNRVSVPPFRQRKFGPSNLSLKAINRRLGWTGKQSGFGRITATPELRAFFQALARNETSGLGHRLTRALFRIRKHPISD
jgi:hypothetical protein